MWLKVERFSDFEKIFWANYALRGSSSFIFSYIYQESLSLDARDKKVKAYLDL